VRPLDAELVEQAERVVGHVAEQVGRLDREACHRAHQVGHGRVDLGRAAGVAVVVPDDVEAAIRKLAAQLQVPVDEVHTQAHHEQEGRVGGIAERLIGDVELAHARELVGHRRKPSPCQTPGRAGPMRRHGSSRTAPDGISPVAKVSPM